LSGNGKKDILNLNIPSYIDAKSIMDMTKKFQNQFEEINIFQDPFS